MLSFYLFPISYAFASFPVAAVLFTLPFLLFQYRKHGYINKYRALLLYLFLLYMMNVLYLIILPLPASIHNEPPQAASYVQLVPFHFVLDILKETAVDPQQPVTYLHLLKERAFLQVVFNVLLTVPFGIFLRYYFRVRWVACLLLSFSLALFFEMTQVTGLYGIYDYPYRLFDIDDLLMNTTGGMLGFVAAAWISAVLPRMDKLDEHVDFSAKRVTYTRRGLAFMMDWLLALPLLAFLSVLDFPYPFVSMVLVYFMVIPYATNGFTAGKWIVRIRLQGKGKRIRLSELLIRYGLLYLLLGGLHVLMLQIVSSSLPNVAKALYTIVLFFTDMTLGIHLLRCVFNRSRRLIYEAKSGTRHVIHWDEEKKSRV
ncbi:VanZ family protein [Paenibacillus sp. FJAT-26967]|uniref:VanZ family protein n=1 Tax=Paenibacillus sp. FJAT-26967 TaxID=1729690 RepID=UPI000838F197|nr:VanZ family protein [Paenibacillus sp. FJAT-26967]